MAREWLSLADSADELDVSPRTIRRWVRAGRLPAELRPGSHGPQYFLPREAVRELLSTRSVEQPPHRVEVDRVVEVVAEYLDARERDYQEQQRLLQQDLGTVRLQLEQAYAELKLAQQALWQQCQDLAAAQRRMQSLGDTLASTRARASATRQQRTRHGAGTPAAADEDVA
ncbi:MAG TPA: helix-turn-helix domain-containing protein [Thermomicrobiaceae bacterium]|nr:helix-turn-helix domain-containing protein [Thermomicrobiaceae bacterium]